MSRIFCLIYLLVLSTTVILCDKKPLYHEQSKKVFEGGLLLPQDALFGYSITYQTQRRMLIISAPMADFQGNVFQCNITQHDACHKIEYDLPMQAGASQTDLKRGVTPFWMGAAVGAGSDFFMACAPRFSSLAKQENRTRTSSRCFYQTAATGLVNDNTIELKDSNKALSNFLFFNDKKMAQKWENRFDTMGWSMDVSSDDVTIVGGPGAAMGRAMIIPKMKTEGPQLIDLTRNYSDPDGLVSYDFGYSVKAGKFLGTEGYAISSPYGTMGKGKVLLFSKSRKYMQAIVDKELGSIFGGALCSARLGEGEDEALLVGAPASAHRSNDETDVGAVHVYLKEAGKMSWKRTLRGYQNNGYFGYAIASVGDLNLDGKDEVAISAPYENEYRGAVYIFSGADLVKDATLKIQWLQRITGDAPDQMLGLGLSSVQDLDDNGCNELSIGLPGNNSAMLMKCMAFITFNLSLSDSLENKNVSTSVFKDMCVNFANFEKLKNIKNNVTVTIKLNHPDALIVGSKNNTLSYNVSSILNAKRDCLPIEIKTPLNGNYEKDVVVQVNASLVGPDQSTLAEYEHGLVMLTDGTQTYLEEKISVPGSNLGVNLSTSFIKDYIIGSTKSENLTIILSNAPSSRGGAYSACVRIRIQGVNVTHTSNNCVPARAPANYTYTCELSKPILAGESTKSSMTLDTESLTAEVGSIEIEAKLYKLCDDAQSLVNITTMSIYLQRDLRITVLGKSMPSAVVNVSEAEIGFGYEDIMHVYSIENTGVTSLGKVTCAISIPQHVNYSISHSEECRRHHSKEVSTCIFKKIASNTKRDIIILMDILPNTPFTAKVNRGKAELETELSCMIAGEKRINRITTTFNLSHKSVPLWIIVVAVVIGLLVLLIMTFALYECGFLRRKHKEELVALKKDVDRQSIRRRSMYLRESMTEKNLKLNNEAFDADSVVTMDITESVYDQPRTRRVAADVH